MPGDNIIHGVCPIIATPFTDDGEVDYASLRNEVEVLAASGCHAAALFGIASEFFKLADNERERMVDIVTDAADEHDLPLVISVTHESTEVAVKWAQSYAEVGADTLMVFTPTFLGPSQENVLEHVRKIGEAVSIPVMVQHHDMSVGVSPTAFAELYNSTPNVRYFKIETNPPGPFISTLLEETNGEVDIFIGSAGAQMIDAYRRGASGVMPAAALHELYLRIHGAYHDDRLSEAMDLHADMLAIQNVIGQLGIQGEKYLLAQRGIVATDYCRKPLPAVPDATQRELLELYYERVETILEG